MRHAQPFIFRRSLGLIGLVWGVSAPSSIALSETIELGATKDNTLYSQGNEYCNGAGENLFTVVSAVPQERRAVLSFDIAGNIPAGSTINSAALRLWVNRAFYITPGQNPPLSVRAHRLTELWGNNELSDPGDAEGFGGACEPGEVSWNSRVTPATAWASPGGSFVAVASATTAVGGVETFATWQSPGMAADVQAWLNGAAPNAGWILVPVPNISGHARRYNSSENPEVGRKPTLIVDFTPPVGAGACCGASGSCEMTSGAGACVGAYQGNGTSCDAGACPEPTGACCIPDVNGTCLDGAMMTEDVCASMDGIFQGLGEACFIDRCSVQPEKFVDPLPIPAVAAEDQPGAYTLRIERTMQELHRDLPPTEVWGIGAGDAPPTYPGPTIEATSDVPITVRYENALENENGGPLANHSLPVDDCMMYGNQPVDDAARIVFHLHGGHVEAASDGFPTSAFLPGQGVDYNYSNRQRAATLWYHDHTMGITRLNTLMGLAGVYIIRDAVEQSFPLPGGAYEVPLVIQDRSFHVDGSWNYPAMWMEHVLGDVALVNGKVWPYLNVARGKYRFRVVNGSGSRTYRLALSNGLTFTQIGSDQGLLAAPVNRTTLLISPGERADVVVDFAGLAPGTVVQMTNDAPAPYPRGGGTPLPDIMQFRVSGDGGYTANLPAAFTPVAAIPEAEADQTREFQLVRDFGNPLDVTACSEAAWALEVNGISDWNTPINGNQGIPLGSTEIWTFRNRSGVAHPMHMHLVDFQILDRQALTYNFGWVTTGPRVLPDVWERGWKDTVRVEPLEQVRVIARFRDYVGPYVVHCHVLEHEDNEMMRQFTVSTTCGDGFVGEPNEECEVVIFGQDTADCDGDCSAVVCGDGRLNATAGEFCEPGGVNTPTCNADCSEALCGDGIVNGAAGELCDGGADGLAEDTPNCDADCTFATCGDGYVNAEAGEACDAFGQNTAACDANCTPAVCGDGTLNPAAGEACDDNNGFNNDGCSATCTIEIDPTGGGGPGGAAQGGAAQGGAAQGGAAQGGAAQGGAAQGGAAQGGAAQGGAAQGGSGQGGTNQGGAAQGGTNQGGAAQGGTNQGGAAQGGSGGSSPQAGGGTGVGGGDDPQGDGCDCTAAVGATPSGRTDATFGGYGAFAGLWLLARRRRNRRG